MQLDEEQRAIIDYRAILTGLAGIIEITIDSKSMDSLNKERLKNLNKKRLEDIKKDIANVQEIFLFAPSYIRDTMKEKYDEIDSVLKLIEGENYETAYNDSMEFLKKPITFHRSYSF